MPNATQLPGQLNCEIYVGATLGLTLTWTADGSPVNLTGYTADFKIKSLYGTVVLEHSTTNGRIALGGSLGTLTLTVAADTSGLPGPGHRPDDDDEKSAVGAEKWGSQPEMPAALTTDSNCVLLEAGFTPENVDVAPDGITQVYSVTGDYL